MRGLGFGDLGASLQAAVGLWRRTYSRTDLFPHPNSSQVGIHNIIKGSWKPLPLGSSYSNRACTCLNIESTSIKTGRVVAAESRAPGRGGKKVIYDLAAPKLELEAG